MKEKFLSRKFLLSLAAFLGSLGMSIAGVAIENQTLAVAGFVCSALSAAIYAACEAWVDAKAVKKEADSNGIDERGN